MKDIPANHSSNYIARLEAALEQSGQTQTMFGYLKFSDPGFVKRARDGTIFRKKTIEKLNAVFAEFNV